MFDRGHENGNRGRKVGLEARGIITSCGGVGPWRSLGARLTGSQKVRGSNPLGSTSVRSPQEPTLRHLSSASDGRPPMEVIMAAVRQAASASVDASDR